MMRSYIIGFSLSLLFTLAAPGLLWLHEHMHHAFPTHAQLRAAFIAFAVVQLIVQLVFFLHVGREEKQQWNVAALGLALFVVGVLMAGTFWIMQNLQYMMHAPDAPDMFMEENISPHAL